MYCMCSWVNNYPNPLSCTSSCLKTPECYPSFYHMPPPCYDVLFLFKYQFLSIHLVLSHFPNFFPFFVLFLSSIVLPEREARRDGKSEGELRGEREGREGKSE